MRTVFILIGAAVVASFLVKGIQAYRAERNVDRSRPRR